ncbi:MAG TPA: hypothetical protein VFK97_01430, partial [Candidatus Saccharimonadales bacterium]|nr:hypothetical protein [Candidatus Saccharimonadales bacterium]
SGGLRLISTKHEAWLDIDKKTAQTYLQKLEKQKADRQQAVKHLQSRLTNKSYLEKAPKQLIADTKNSLEETKTALKTLEAELASFQKSLKG